MSKTDLISIEKIEKAIYFVRGEKVMLDRDLARLYDVPIRLLPRTVLTVSKCEFGFLRQSLSANQSRN